MDYALSTKELRNQRSEIRDQSNQLRLFRILNFETENPPQGQFHNARLRISFRPLTSDL
jgi:hypothetical protein